MDCLQTGSKNIDEFFYVNEAVGVEGRGAGGGCLLNRN
jgi:hypothetical protein